MKPLTIGYNHREKAKESDPWITHIHWTKTRYTTVNGESMRLYYSPWLNPHRDLGLSY
jgi:hypothetical protein